MSYDVYLKDAITGQILELDSPHQVSNPALKMRGLREKS
jgi:hypothetical protein